MLGTLVSLTGVVLIWKPYYLYKFGFKRRLISYWTGSLKLFACFCATFLIIALAIHKIDLASTKSFYDWFLRAIILSIASILVYFSLLFSFNKGFRDLFMRILSKILNLRY